MLTPLLLALTVGQATPEPTQDLLFFTPEPQATVGGRMQLMGFGELLADPAKSGGRVYLFQTQSRLWLDAHLGGDRLFTQLALGGEDVVEAPNPGVGLSLLDMSLELPFTFGTVVAGQFKVPYGREQLTNSGDMAFNGRSIGYLGVRTGRDVGVALRTAIGYANVTAGVFTGGGRDVPAEYIPEVLGVPMLALRASLGDADEGQDPNRLAQHVPLAQDLRCGVAANALFMRDSLVGHSTIMNVKSQDNGLLTNPRWNPYLARTPYAQGDLYQVGLDAAAHAPWGHGVVSAEAQLDHAGYANTLGSLQLTSGHAQVSYYLAPFELALRYGLLVPDAGFAAYDAGKNTTTPLGLGAPIHELTPAVSLYFPGDFVRLTLDAPILFNAPVVTEPGVGAYVLTDMPNETTPLSSGGSVSSQTVPQARLLLQAAF